LHAISTALAKLSATLALWGPWGILLLGFIDSAGIPVAVGMDILVVAVAAKAPERAFLAAAMAVMGSLGGNLLLFYAARHGFSRFVSHTPQSGKPQRFRAWFERYGLATVFIPALVPIIPLPLKVFVVSAGVLRTRPRSFTLVVLAARILRYGGVAWLGYELGENSTAFLRTHAWDFAGAAVLLFAGTYLLLKFTDRRRQA
jgi:membrane protein YqaA with SNARE-associated domain